LKLSKELQQKPTALQAELDALSKQSAEIAGKVERLLGKRNE
jgi:hypothetical protein